MAALVVKRLVFAEYACGKCPRHLFEQAWRKRSAGHCLRFRHGEVKKSAGSGQIQKLVRD